MWLGKETGVLLEDALISLLLFLSVLGALPAVVYHPSMRLPLCGSLSLVSSLLDSEIRKGTTMKCHVAFFVYTAMNMGKKRGEKSWRKWVELGEGPMSQIGSVHRTWPRHPRREERTLWSRGHGRLGGKALTSLHS